MQFSAYKKQRCKANTSRKHADFLFALTLLNTRPRRIVYQYDKKYTGFVLTKSVIYCKKQIPIIFQSLRDAMKNYSQQRYALESQSDVGTGGLAI
jgi:hypothetical protein